MINNRTAKKTLAIIGLLFCSQLFAADLFNDLATMQGTWNTSVDNTQYDAIPVTNTTGSGFLVTTITLPLDIGLANTPINISICPDNNNLPATTGCSAYTNTSPLTQNSLQNFVYTGSYTVPANAKIWVTATTTDTSGQQSWFTDTSTNAFSAMSQDQGATWVATYGTLPVAQLSGNPITQATTTTAVPTLQWWGILMSILLLLFLYKRKFQSSK